MVCDKSLYFIFNVLDFDIDVILVLVNIYGGTQTYSFCTENHLQLRKPLRFFLLLSDDLDLAKCH
jgi:hypothetical protein